MIKVKQTKKKVSVLRTLAEIKDFVRHCKKDPMLAGFNIKVSTKGYNTYILAKCVDSLKAKYVLPIDMDYVNPVERPLIENALKEELYGAPMTPEEMEAEMVCKSEPYND